MKTKAKFVGITLLVILVLGGFIWGSYWLEDYSKRIKTVVIERPGRDLFEIEFEEQEGPTVFVQCDEDEFEEGFREFRRFLHIKEPPLTIPGGPMLLAQLPTQVSEDLKPVQRTAIELLKRYSPSRIILLAHSDCLLYDTVAAWQNELDAVKDKQFEDMERAVAAIRRWLPNTKVEVYYAFRDGKRLRFNPVDLTPHAGTEVVPFEVR